MESEVEGEVVGVGRDVAEYRLLAPMRWRVWCRDRYVVQPGLRLVRQDQEAGIEAAGEERHALQVGRSQRAGRIVTGFGEERVEDVAEDARRREREGARRGVQRREEGTRGREHAHLDDHRVEKASPHAILPHRDQPCAQLKEEVTERLQSSEYDRDDHIE